MITVILNLVRNRNQYTAAFFSSSVLACIDLLLCSNFKVSMPVDSNVAVYVTSPRFCCEISHGSHVPPCRTSKFQGFGFGAVVMGLRSAKDEFQPVLSEGSPDQSAEPSYQLDRFQWSGISRPSKLRASFLVTKTPPVLRA